MTNPQPKNDRNGNLSSSTLFSVVIPTYHRNDLLAKCLDRLAPGEQTLSSDFYEVIVTDDGRESTAEEMIKTYYPWAKWIAGSKKGPAANRNNGSQLARGEWLVFTDDDCLPDPNWLESFKEAITDSKFAYEGKVICQEWNASPLEYAPINLTGGCFWSCNIMISKSIFQHLNGFDERFKMPHLEDVDLRERILSLDLDIVFVSQAIIDHPPKIVDGRSLALLHESDVYYYHQKKLQKLSFAQLSIVIVSGRLRKIYQSKKGIGSLLALISILSELLVTWNHFEFWQQRYPLKELSIHPSVN